MQKKQLIQFSMLLVLILILAGAYAGIRSYNSNEEKKIEQQEADAKITLTSFQPKSITDISYDFDGTQYTFSNAQGEWKLSENTEMVLDQEKFENFLEDAGSLTAVQEIEPEAIDDEEDYGFDNPLRTVSVTTENGTSSLTFGMKNEMLGQYYLKTSESSRIYLVEESVYTVFDKTAEDFEKEEEEETQTDTDEQDIDMEGEDAQTKSDE